MSEELKPGDVCSVIAAPCLTAQGRLLIGRECLLLGYAPTGEWRHPPHATFVVRFIYGHETVLCEACLRRQPPPPARSGRYETPRERTPA